jgi:opacity protein-like surface antigen
MRTLLLALLALAVTPTVHAQAGAAYYGIALGNFEYEESNFLGFPGGQLSDKTSSYRLMVGYQFMEYLAVEGGYGKTGSIRDTVTLPDFPTGTFDLNARYELSMLTIRLVGVLPFDNGVSLLAGLGYHDTKRKFAFDDGIDSVSGDDTANEPGYYVGAQYDWDRVAVRVSYEKFDYDGGVDVNETSVTFFYKI